MDALCKTVVKPPNQAVVHVRSQSPSVFFLLISRCADLSSFCHASLSTQHSVSSSNYLQRLESITSAVVHALLSALPSSSPGETLTLPVPLPSSSTTKVAITLPPLGRTPPQPARLQRLRKQYTTLNKQARGELGDDKIAELFATWLDQSFRGV